MNVNMNKHIWEGWTVGAFIEELEHTFDMIMNNRSHMKPFKTKEELKKWLMDNQPYYKKHIPDVYKYLQNLKTDDWGIFYLFLNNTKRNKI